MPKDAGKLKPLRLVGRYIELTIDPNDVTCSPAPFPTVLTIGGRLIIGGIWKSSGCRPDAVATNLYGTFQELIDICTAFLHPRSGEWGGVVYPREEARKLGFDVGDDTELYQTSLFVDQSVTSVFFELVGETLRIHYFNYLLKWSDCEGVQEIHKGTVEIPFMEFAEDVLVLSRRFLTEIAPVLEEVCPESDDPAYLWEMYLELQRMLVGGYD